MSTSWSQRWAQLSTPQRVLLALLALVVVVNVVPAAVGSILGGGDPGGPVSSSFATDEQGLAAYSDLLEEAGHRVTRSRDDIGDIALDPAGTVVLADPDSLGEADVRALGRFVSGGGRLVLAGRSVAPLAAVLTGTAVERRQGEPVSELEVWVPDEAVGAAQTVVGDDGGRWESPGPLLGLVGADGEATLVAGDVGEGRLLALTDAAPLHNQHLAEADNASLGLGLAGPAERPVLFVESVHGYGRTGLDALPSQWKAAGLGLLVALVVGLWSAASRFGPPEPSERVLRPPRLDHVHAVAAGLERVSPRPATVPAEPRPEEPPP